MFRAFKLFTRAIRAVESIRNSKFSHHYPHVDADLRCLKELGKTYRGCPEDKWPASIKVKLQRISQRYLPTTWHINPTS